MIEIRSENQIAAENFFEESNEEVIGYAIQIIANRFPGETFEAVTKAITFPEVRKLADEYYTRRANR